MTAVQANADILRNLGIIAENETMLANLNYDKEAENKIGVRVGIFD